MQELSPYHGASHLPPSINREGPLFEEKGIGNLQDYWIATWKYRWTAIGCLLSAVALAIVFVLIQESVYTASATVEIEGELPNVTGVQPDSGIWSSPDRDYYETQFNLLRSRSLVAKVIQELKLQDDERFRLPMTLPLWIQRGFNRTLGTVKMWMEQLGLVEKSDQGAGSFELGVHPDLIGRYLQLLGVEPVKKSKLVEISFSSVDPVLSKEVANAHAATFIRMNLQTRFELTAEAEQFLKEKLAELKKRVEESEEALTRFRKAYKITSMEKGENLMVERLVSLNRDLTEARSKRIELESLNRVVQQKDNQLLSQVVDNRLIHQLKDQIAGLELEAARLETKFTPTYPRLASLQEQINQARSRMNRELGRIVRTIEADYAAAKAKEEALTQVMDNEKQAALDLQEQVIEYTILEREAASNRTLYENVLKKTKETNLSGEVPISNMHVTDRAEAPVRPDSERTLILLCGSMVIGLLGGVGLAFFRHYLDDTLKTPEDIEQYLRLPTLGIVPDIIRLNGRANLGYAKKVSLPQSVPEKQQKKGGELVVFHHPFSLITEAYRVIRTAILFSKPEHAPRSILITSSEPREGKTITSVNIAISLAQLGNSVLLVDADLRIGRCHKVLGLRNGSGLTNVLTGNADVSEVIQKTAISNLHFLSRGEIPPNPTELLGSEKMQQTLEILKRTFSFVIIDSAPLLPITDTVLLSTVVDGVVLVARGQSVSRYTARQAHERLSYVKARVLGVILNGIDIHGPEFKAFKHSYASYYTHYAGEEENSESYKNINHEI